MIPVCEIITAEQGPYEWGVRDCLTTAVALVTRATDVPQYRNWIAGLHQKSEKRAWGRAVKRGGPFKWHLENLQGHGRVVEEFGSGSLVFFQSLVRTRNGCALEAKRGQELMGFVDDGFDVWHWTPHGLSPVSNSPDVRGVITVCRQ